MTISRFSLVKTYSSYSLIKPSTNSIITIVHTTSFSAPIFPSRCRTMVNHIQITGIITFLHHLIEEIHLFIPNSPFCQNRHSNQTNSNMSFMLFFGHHNDILFHFIIQRIRYNTYQHRIAHIQLWAGRIDSFIRTVERLMNQLVKFFSTNSKLFRLFSFS